MRFDDPATLPKRSYAIAALADMAADMSGSVRQRLFSDATNRILLTGRHQLIRDQYTFYRNENDGRKSSSGR